MNEPTLFVPFTGKHGAAPVQRETRLIRDYTMPARDWSPLESPAWERLEREKVERLISKLEIDAKRSAELRAQIRAGR